MKYLNKLIPQFLKDIDTSWQQRYPRLWSTRVHYHLWFILLLNIVMFLIGMVIRVELFRFTSPQELFEMLMLPIFIYFAFWVYKVLLFSVEKRQGISRSWDAVLEFLVLFGSIALILTIPYNLALTVSYRAGHQISTEEFSYDVDHLNEWEYTMHSERGFFLDTVPIVEQDAEDYQYDHERHYDYGIDYSMDRHQYFRSLREYENRKNISKDAERERELDAIYEDYKDSRQRAMNVHSDEYSPRQARRYASSLDSIETHHPYLLERHGYFSPSNYNYRSWDVTDIGYDDRVATSYPFEFDDVLEKEYLVKVRSGRLPTMSELEEVIRIMNKYKAHRSALSAAQWTTAYQNRRPCYDGPLSVDGAIDRIWRAKNYQYDFMDPEMFLFMWLNLVFMLTLIVSIFKQVYWQPFLISIVTSILFPIVLVVTLLIFSSFNRVDEDDVFMISYGLIFVFLIASLFGVKRLRSYTTISSVLTILGNVVLPFVLLYLLILIEKYFDIFMIDAIQMQLNGIDQRNPNWEIWIEKREHQTSIFHLVSTCLWLGGIVLYILVGHSWLRKLHQHLIALPERK